MAHKIALVTDSTCDIPEDWRRQYDIEVVPMTIIFGNQQFLDGVEMTAEQFYERLLKESHHPTTAQATPKAFLEAFQKAASKGAEQIIAFTISSFMSGTYQSAKQAAQEASIPVHVVDSRNNSMGMGWQIIAAARVREAGGWLEEMLEAAEQVRKNMVYYISLNTIEYLSKGGRIAGATKFLDSILQIKPLIYVKPDMGTVGASVPSRMRKAAIDALYKEFFRHFNLNMGKLHITVLHNNALQEAQALAERVQQDYSPKELFITIVSPILGVHTGPQAIALCGYAER